MSKLLKKIITFGIAGLVLMMVILLGTTVHTTTVRATETTEEDFIPDPEISEGIGEEQTISGDLEETKEAQSGEVEADVDVTTSDYGNYVVYVTLLLGAGAAGVSSIALNRKKNMQR